MFQAEVKHLGGPNGKGAHGAPAMSSAPPEFLSPQIDPPRPTKEGLNSASWRVRSQLGVAWLLPDTTKAKNDRPHQSADRGRCETLPSASQSLPR